MDLINFCRFGYVLIFGTFILMIWVSLSGARELEVAKYPPCYFNPLCSCSKGFPDLGIVQCQNVYLPRVPDTINISKVFMLHLENNNLRGIEPHFLQSTGLYKIVISKNPLAFISDEAFLGLERSLWKLELSYDQLTHIPNRALRYLQKLRLLDLTGNEIIKIVPENWRGLEQSLTTLILVDNSISSLPTDAFTGLPLLETIDLSGNNLKDIDPSVFRDGMGKLTNVILADNQFTSIPYQALSFLKELRNLDLSYNRITKMSPAADVGVQNVNYNFLFKLNTLRLDYNEMHILESASFQYFEVVNRTILDGNPLVEIKESAFRQARIKEIFLRYCDLTHISPLAFAGLENFLEILDLSGNRITDVTDLFHGLEILKTLSLRDNLMEKLDSSLHGFQFSLNKLDLSGNTKLGVSFQELRKLRNLRVMSVSTVLATALSAEDFVEFGVDMEELEVTGGGLQTLKNNAFKHLHGLRKLTFANTKISSIESDAFYDIGHSLTSLRLSHALSSSVQNFPADAIKTLFNLKELDLSNNRIKQMPDTSFHFLKKLQVLNLQDNIIEMVNKGTFQGDIHRDLERIYFSFNNIKLIQQHTFTDLAVLKQLYLDDNKIETLQKRSFMNLVNLKRLNLKGNKIKSMALETFQNLPELEDLDLSYNLLTSLDFTVFDQVGTLAMFQVNVSHNKIEKLVINPVLDLQPEIGVGGIHSNIRVLDLSFNNISSISKSFFRPVELSLGHLYLNHNKLLNATKDVFGNMPHLQVLDLSSNSLYELDFDTFRNTKKLQIFSAASNRIAEIPNDLFRFLGNLRTVDFSHNRLRVLPDNLFRETGLERLDLSHNLLGKLPINSLSVASAVTLCELDLSWNTIASISHGGLLAKFKSLSLLDLSYNRLGQIDAGIFKGLPKLSGLNLGHNNQMTLDVNGLSFQGLEYSLLHLNLDNVSLSQVPALPTHRLITLSIADNTLPTIPSEIVGNISTLRTLNLNHNDLSVIPIVIHSMAELRDLSLADNPFSELSNTSFLGVANQLKSLDISSLNLKVLETGVFCKMQSLRNLKMDLYKGVKNFNIPRLIQHCNGLKSLQLSMVQDSENLEDVMHGDLPSKLKNVTIVGQGLKKVPSKTFQGIRSTSFHIGLYNTSVLKISTDMFKNMNRVRNVSIDVQNNPLLKTLQNPSTGTRPNLPGTMFLTELKLTGSKWSCDCDLGWVEVWKRKCRQYNCPKSDDDLRTTLCANKNNQSFIEVLKTEIECGWSSAQNSRSFTSSILLLLYLVIVAIV